MLKKMASNQSASRPWPADKVERWPTDRLVPAARNARLHTDEDVQAICASIKRFGFTSAVLVDEGGEIIAGHARVLAAKRLKFQTVPVMVARNWTADEKAAYLIADNQLAARGTWDDALLREQLARLSEAGFEVPVLGFDPAALQGLMAPTDRIAYGDADAVVEPPTKPVSQRGDLWSLGHHRVLCGDSTCATDVQIATSDTRPTLMVSDPPYGVEYDPSWRGRADGKKTGRSLGKVLNDDRADWREAWAHFPGDVAYIWHAGLFGGVVADSLTACDFQLRSQIVWVKPHFVLSRADYHWAHETCWYAVREGTKSHWASDRKQSTVWQFSNNSAIGNPDREKVWGHGAQKPVEAMRRPIEHNSAPGDVIYDPFLGSGTTIIAAELTGRIAVGLELNPAYVDVIVRRWCEFTGQQAVHLATGMTFSELADERQSESNSDVPATIP